MLKTSPAEPKSIPIKSYLWALTLQVSGKVLEIPMYEEGIHAWILMMPWCVDQRENWAPLGSPTWQR